MAPLFGLTLPAATFTLPLVAPDTFDVIVAPNDWVLIDAEANKVNIAPDPAVLLLLVEMP